MPSIAYRPCAHPGCPAVVRDGRYCAAHREASPEAQARRHKVADPFYRTERWRKFRAWFLRRHPLCDVCSAPATVADHRTPRDEGGADYDEENLRPLCAPCHARQPGHGFTPRLRGLE